MRRTPYALGRRNEPAVAARYVTFGRIGGKGTAWLIDDGDPVTCAADRR